MPFTIVTTNNARNDIQIAIHWENERSAGLGQRFLNDLENKFAALCITPAIGSIRYDNVRCTMTESFQYVIHYLVMESKKLIIILRVLHIRRKPVH